MISATEINRTYNLLNIISDDTQLKKSGNWYIGPCPFCGGDDRFVMKSTPEGWRWLCRKCGDGKYHTAIDYVMSRENLSFYETCKFLDGDIPIQDNEKIILQDGKPEPTINREVWRTRAIEFINSCEIALWGDEGSKARDWMFTRGLKEKTLKRHHIGYNPGDPNTSRRDLFDKNLDDWGIKDPDIKAIRLPRGIVIPWFTKDFLWCVKFRLPVSYAQTKKGINKYIKLKGSLPGIFGYENLRGAWLAVFTEGEFDCMLLDQEAGDLVGVATLGGASEQLQSLDLSLWGNHLLSIAYILATYDNDPAGSHGGKILDEFSDRIIKVALPEISGVKDITDLWQTGHDLGDWICRTVEALGLLQKGIPVNTAERALHMSDIALEAGDLSKFARLFAYAAELLGANNPIIPWSEWIESYKKESLDKEIYEETQNKSIEV